MNATGSSSKSQKLEEGPLLNPGVEEDAELKWGHLKFLALTHPPPPP